MSIALGAVVIRHERRIRAIFTNTLAAAAFTTPTLYVVTSVDGTAANPTVLEALVVPNSPEAVELALGADLVAGRAYQVSAVGVPCTDTTVTPAGSIQTFNPPTPNQVAGVEVGADDIQNLLYGVDLVHNGVDYVETSNGDLATIGGRSNAISALRRRAVAQGLPWNGAYGVKPRDFIDGPMLQRPQLRGRLILQMVADDRVDSVVNVSASQDATDVSACVLSADVSLVGAPGAETLSITVPRT